MPVCRLIIPLSLILPPALLADDWPQWRGPNRNGISAETGLLSSWPKDGPKLVWKAKTLGEGYSSFSVVGDRLYTMGQGADVAFVVAFDTKTGEPVWRASAGGAFRESRGNGPRGTPTIDGNRLYAMSADGTLLCLDRMTGKAVWGFNVARKFGAQAPNWAYSESPLVEGDLVIVTPGGRGASVVALSKSTGEPVWKSQDDPAGYSSPIAFDLDGKRKIAVFTARNAMVLDLKTGELLWKYDKVANRVANIATPIVSDGHAFFSSDYGTGCALLKLSPPAGSTKPEEVYFKADMRNHYTTSVLVGEHLYGFSSSILAAMNFHTGKLAWSSRSVGKGNCIYADLHLYCQGEDGTIGLIEASPSAYKEKSRFQIHRGNFPTWTPPVIAGGRLYVREQDNLYCYDIKR